MPQWRHRGEIAAGPLVEPMRLSEHQPALFDFEPAPAPAFRFETDASGIVRWVEGAARAPLIGLSLVGDGLTELMAPERRG